MRITRYDQPIGHARVAPITLPDAPASLSRRCIDAGLHKSAGSTFLARHPECAGWDHARIVEQLLANRDQRAVARRQVRKGQKGFGGIRYA